jgi:hypothetical protein
MCVPYIKIFFHIFKDACTNVIIALSFGGVMWERGIRHKRWYMKSHFTSHVFKINW